MYRVMIVEDEFIVRYGIRSMIDWEKIGLQLAGEAANGKEALELMEAGMPDILITDIKMPVMDGIELIAKVRAASPEIKIIILSNLEDFQYAKEAIKHGVSEYLIKSDMMPRDFEQSLLALKENLDAVRKGRVAEGKSASPEPVYKEKFLLDIIEGHMWEENREEQAETLGMARLHSAYLMHVSLNAAEHGYTERQSSIRRAAEQLRREDHWRYELFPDKQGDMNMLWTQALGEREPSDGMAPLLDLANDLILRLSEAHGLRATIGISGRFSDWAGMKEAYAQAVHAAKQKMFLGSGRVIVHGSDDMREPESQAEHFKISTHQIQSMVYAFQTKELMDDLEDVFEQLAARRDVELVQIVSLELLMVLTTLWQEVSNDPQQVLQLKKQYFDELSKLETLEQSRAWFIQSFEALMRHMNGMYHNDRNSIIKATQYIQQFYHQEISLQSISSLVHLSKNYFANLFKKEVGESFLEYLTRIRIEKAKSLLTGELKAGDVGSLVGIHDPKYFSKVFKKITGVSPSEYRQWIREHGGNLSV
ncbi:MULTISPECIES: response regulator [Paenibacillus]|uniref:AraC family transcriptional regulator n=1 Tax=Paenibacillus albilobatus TaxID=2716884 RepID=A0A919XN63_9BACL|nr:MULTISPECIES: response regulator [Paenibacillus]GIO34478.1 AraC family transcriptional regulator [Paenibacillus albilobatus]